ncbi:hypothetical protein WICMUC_002890 [Wickerhamomyces mucosus]|uniref:Uncharacterized protein n=1 Tax=Wickerhamomyces mucosus TaxID=1378264 RepID=A0A9P8PMK0_9ASCO|nr:hypothetical protein WICMUC_002890 [Wickerhamomyces mucosus]
MKSGISVKILVTSFSVSAENSVVSEGTVESEREFDEKLLEFDEDIDSELFIAYPSSSLDKINGTEFKIFDTNPVLFSTFLTFSVLTMALTMFTGFRNNVMKNLTALLILQLY